MATKITQSQRRELAPMLAAPRIPCLSRAAVRWGSDAGAARLDGLELRALVGDGCGRRAVFG